MKINKLHEWDISFSEAAIVQKELAKRVVTRGKVENPEIVAGVDMAYDKATDQAFASVVVMEYPSFEVIDIYSRAGIISIPYVPGYLSFREAPLILDILEEIDHIDLLYVDGQGIAHPRGLGLAAHVGLFVEIPTIGCAKSRLVGEYEDPDKEKGSFEPMYYKNQQIGTVLRTRTNVKPIFVSPGNKISIKQATKWALKAAVKYKLPEPVRLADKEVSRFKKETLK
jgi:deoxyribonuclease V